MPRAPMGSEEFRKAARAREASGRSVAVILTEATVAPSTRVAYEASLRRLDQLTGDLSWAEPGQPVDKRAFLEILATLVTMSRAGTQSSRVYRAAISYRLKSQGKEDWTEDAEVCTAVRGFQYASRDGPNKPRGAIEEPMLLQLVALTNDEEIKLMLLLQWHAALRISELTSLRVGCLTNDGTRSWITLGCNKAQNSRSASRGGDNAAQTRRKPITEATVELLETAIDWAECAGRTTRLFTLTAQTFRNRFNALVAQTGWSEEFDWHNHSLRHGGTADLLRAEMAEVAASAKAGMSRGTLHHYARSNEERLEKVGKRKY